MRILVCAFACAPHKGSEPGAGWAVVEASARAVHVFTVMTARHNRSDIERGLRDGRAVASRIRVEYVGMPTSLFRWWDRFGRPGKQLHYLLCQQAITRITSRLHQAVPFDVAHHVTIAAGLHALRCEQNPTDCRSCGALYVGGAQHIPASCRRWLGWRGRSLELARRLLADLLRHVAALRTARRAALVVSQNDDAARYWSKRGIRAVTRPNVFLDDPQLETDSPLPWNAASERRHAVCVGRLVAWKGVHLALATMAEPAAAGWELHSSSAPGRKRRATARAHPGARA